MTRLQLVRNVAYMRNSKYRLLYFTVQKHLIPRFVIFRSLRLFLNGIDIMYFYVFYALKYGILLFDCFFVLFLSANSFISCLLYQFYINNLFVIIR